MKLKNTLLLIFIIFNSLDFYSQNYNSKLYLMQGIWRNIMNNDTEKAFCIISGMNSLDFVYNNDSDELNFPLGESLIGFQNFDSGEGTIMKIDSLKDDGLSYTVVDKKYINEEGYVKRPNYLTPSYFECDGIIMSINGGKLVEYVKIEKLPYDALIKLYYRGKLDNRDYIKEYLNLDVRELKNKSLFYDEERKKTGIYLEKGDIVIIIQEEGGWIKVEYGENNKQGWIRKENLSN